MIYSTSSLKYESHMAPSLKYESHMVPSIERDAVRMTGLHRRSDLNGCYGLIQNKWGDDKYEVRIAKTTIFAKCANLEFVGHVPMVFNADGVTDDMRTKGLVLDADMRTKYLGADPEVVPMTFTPEMLADLSQMMGMSVRMGM